MITTSNQAELLTKPCKVKVDDAAGNEDENKGAPMLGRAGGHPLIELRDRNEVS